MNSLPKIITQFQYKFTTVTLYDFTSTDNSQIKYCVICEKHNKNVYYGYKKSLKDAIKLYTKKLNEVVE